MAKIVNISQNISQINFDTPHREFEVYYQNFLSTPIGQIYQVIPWDDLVKLFRKKKKSKTRKGRNPIFDIKGKLALMFLKSYTGSSDKKLIERLNTDYTFQFFCGIYLRAGQELKDFKIASVIRCQLAEVLSIEEFQKTLAKHWRPYLKERNLALMDATCYETNMRYPTNVKLLWECCQWIYGQMKRLNKQRKGRMPRSKFAEQKNKYLAYQKNRKKTHKKTQKRIRSLLYLLDKLLAQLNEMETTLPKDIGLPAGYYKRRDIICKVSEQQRQWFETKEKPKDLIVSIDKDYIRPIVRGKEIKRVEFGAKVNTIQIDGINFIEHLSFDAFHEGIRMVESIQLAQALMHKKCTHAAADKIYATNANRKWCSQQGITTNFVRKGRAGKYESQRKQISSILSKERSTRMEGSFGTEKEHYCLYRIRARLKYTEILWIVFGIHTANAVRMTEKMPDKKSNSPPRQKAA